MCLNSCSLLDVALWTSSDIVALLEANEQLLGSSEPGDEQLEGIHPNHMSKGTSLTIPMRGTDTSSRFISFFHQVFSPACYFRATCTVLMANSLYCLGVLVCVVNMCSYEIHKLWLAASGGCCFTPAF